MSGIEIPIDTRICFSAFYYDSLVYLIITEPISCGFNYNIFAMSLICVMTFLLLLSSLSELPWPFLDFTPLYKIESKFTCKLVMLFKIRIALHL